VRGESLLRYPPAHTNPTFAVTEVGVLDAFETEFVRNAFVSALGGAKRFGQANANERVTAERIEKIA
jgi:hypothetical protein